MAAAAAWRKMAENGNHVASIARGGININGVISSAIVTSAWHHQRKHGRYGEKERLAHQRRRKR